MGFEIRIREGVRLNYSFRIGSGRKGLFEGREEVEIKGGCVVEK